MQYLEGNIEGDLIDEVKTVIANNNLQLYIYRLDPKCNEQLLQIGAKKELYLEASLAVLLSWYSNWPGIIQYGVMKGNDLSYAKVEVEPTLTLKQFLVDYQESIIDAAKVSILNLSNLPWPCNIIINHGKYTNQINRINLDKIISFCDGNIDCYYNPALYIEKTLEYIFDNYQIILNNMLCNHTKTLLDSTILGKAELDYIHNCAHTPIGYEYNLPIESMIKEACNKYANKIAVKYGNLLLNYNELEIWTNRLAHFLHKRGINNKDRIIIFLPRSLEFIVALIGILKSGASFIPIDLKTPKSRMQYIIADSESKLIITDNDHYDAFKEENKIEAINIHTLDIFSNNHELPTFNNTSSEAYVIYTSGSAGYPKGVSISSKSLTFYSLSAKKSYNINKTDIVLQFSSLSFDAMIEEIFPTLISGATLVLRDEFTLSDPTCFLEMLGSEQITVLSLPTSYWRELVKSGHLSQYIPSSLRLVIIGGEAVYSDDIKLWQAAIINHTIKLINTYGPTETTVVTCMWEVPKNSNNNISIQHNNPPIGKPIPGSFVYLIDRFGRMSPIGGLGEIIIGGPGVGIGYIKPNETNQQKFFSLEYKQNYIKRFYKSGDLGKYASDGNLLYLGRNDNQIKIQGFRVELEEITNFILSSSIEIEDVILVPFTYEKLGESSDLAKIVCFIKPKRANTFSIEPITRYLKENLPYYMLPSRFIILKAFPKTVNNKIDLKQLKSIAQQKEENNQVPYNISFTNTERRLAEIWRKVLGNIVISKDSNFFSIGGGSLNVVRIYPNIYKTFGVRIPLNQIYHTPTLSSLALAIDNMAKKDIANKVSTHLLENFVNWRVEEVRKITIPKSLKNPLSSSSSTLKKVLLTGATGFLGIHLLSNLTNEGYEVYCLIRASTDQEAYTRLLAISEEYKVKSKINYSNVHIVLGNLNKKFLGIETAEYYKLTQVINVVVHCAADVNMLASYKELYNTNVEGTRRVAEFCTLSAPKKLHYISTLAIFDSDPAPQIVEDNTPLDKVGELRGGYAQTKWVADKMISNLSTDNLDAVIYRCGRIWGASDTHIPPKDDFILKFILGCLELKLFPDIEMELDVVPVDYLSKAIVSSIKQQKTLKKVFHLANTNKLLLKDIINFLCDSDPSIRVICYKEWKNRINLLLYENNFDQFVIAPLISVFESSKPDEWVDSYFSSSQSTQYLHQQYNITFPEIRINTVSSYIKSLKRGHKY